MEEDKPKELSKYNEAALQIMRLHEKWGNVDKFLGKGDLENAKYELDKIWNELIADTGKLKEPKKCELKNRLFRIRVLKSKNATELYKNINDRIKFLKLLQQEVGKGAIYKEDTEDDMEG